MIKAIILDIDGVLVGEKQDFNFPHPHPDVLHTLQMIHKNGIPIILCTAKPHFSVDDIIQGAHLNNPHITDGGAIIIDPVDHIVVEKLLLEKSFVKDILSTAISHNVYAEVYTTEDYFVQEDQITEITNVHNAILQRKVEPVQNIIQESENLDVTKIMLIAKNEEDKKRVSALVEPFHNHASINWGLHQTALPRQFCFIVNKNTSKKDAVIKAIANLHLSFENVLGIGDTTGDWKFIELCGYGATLANGSEEIKKLVATKGEGKFCIGKSVDENGLLDVVDYFKLLPTS